MSPVKHHFPFLAWRAAVCLATALVARPVAAGLDLADGPLFVTEPTPPNVLLHPIFLRPFNELSARNFPHDEFDDCRKDPIGANCTTDLNNIFRYYDAWWSSNFGQWGLTRPWPGTYCTTSTSTVIGTTCTSLRSNVDLYNMWGGVDAFSSAYVDHSAAGITSTDTAPWSPGPYFRSNLNFLYYNPAETYQPWPSLGGYSFSNANPAAAPYHPLKPGLGSLNTLATSIEGWGRWSNESNDYVTMYYRLDNPRRYYTYKGGKVYDPASFTLGTVVDDQNYANWYTYYRSSWLASRAIVSNFLKGIDQENLGGRLRLGLAVNTKLVTIGGGSKLVPFTGGNIADFMSRLYADPGATGSQLSPNTALEYLMTDEPYRDDPANAASPTRSCRRNFEVFLLPDMSAMQLSYAYVNDPSLNPNLPGDKDASDTTGIISAEEMVPYKDPTPVANTFGDAGMQAWATDLKTGTGWENTLVPTATNPATWQHLVRYVVAPKAVYNATDYPNNVFVDGVCRINRGASQTNPWPNFDGFNPFYYPEYLHEMYDDLCHMAFNSRGDMFLADNAVQAVESLRQALVSILSQSSSGAAVAANTSSTAHSGILYSASVDTAWLGHLQAYSVNDLSSPLWDAAQQVSSAVPQAHTSRKIITYKTGNGREGVPFAWDALSDDQQRALRSDVGKDDDYAQALLDYLRGDVACEATSAASTCSYKDDDDEVSFSFRYRSQARRNAGDEPKPYDPNDRKSINLLGYIANSSPRFVGPITAGLSDVSYPGFNDHRKAYKNRSGVVYVGGNDGMLHAIKTPDCDLNADAGDGLPNCASAGAGQELFAYVPGFLYGPYPDANGDFDDPFYPLEVLARGQPPHYYVDGSPMSAEAYFDGAWRTVLAGGANKGGKGYYLMDVTSLSGASTEANFAAKLKWEFGCYAEHSGNWRQDCDDPDLGYTFNIPADQRSTGMSKQIVRTNDCDSTDPSSCRWALIVGNGYTEQSGGKAALYVLFLDGPGANKKWDTGGNEPDYVKLVASDVSYASDGGKDTNGLSTPTPFDLNGDGNADVVYAGDLNGNLWKFNISDGDPAKWRVDQGLDAADQAITCTAADCKPIFVARDDGGKRQPIVAPPELSLHRAGTVTGTLVMFATGKLIESGDRANTDVQTAYGVWDRGDVFGLARGHLLEQEMNQSNGVRTSANPEPVQYCSQVIANNACQDTNGQAVTAQHGWYWDMTDRGERLTGITQLIEGLLFFNTYIPTEDPCGQGGSGWLMVLDYINGVTPSLTLLDTTGDGTVDSDDSPSSGIKLDTATVGGTSFVDAPGGVLGIYSKTADGGLGETGLIPLPGGGRVSWQELLD